MENRIEVYSSNPISALGRKRWSWRGRAANNHGVVVPGENFINRHDAYANIRIAAHILGGDASNAVIFENGTRVNEYGSYWVPPITEEDDEIVTLDPSTEISPSTKLAEPITGRASVSKPRTSNRPKKK
jgi:hypothetical protein